MHPWIKRETGAKKRLGELDKEQHNKTARGNKGDNP